MNNLNSTEPSLLERLVLRVRRTAARRELLSRSDRELADFGLSRALLEEGVEAWPWRVSASAADGLGGTRSRIPRRRRAADRDGHGTDARQARAGASPVAA